MGPDQGEGGAGVGQRLIPEEPMSIVLNLGISREFFLPHVMFLDNSPFPLKCHVITGGVVFIPVFISPWSISHPEFTLSA